ncbi:MAG: YetF domain-containing protein [Brevundimonas sp.]|jgi:uncharacterized membrane protein YcaP (DUF421 family)|uniref:DUF421 domain-containing protein n=1 Tax=Brevundimonas sp. TaxID=1871086 RepID=UPI003001E504
MSEFMEILHSLIGSDDGTISWWQMSIRGALIFAVGVFAVRVAASRAFGKWTPLDIIFAVIVGSNLSRAMTGSAPFLPTLIASLVLVAIHTILARASARWGWLSFLVKGGRVQLVREGEQDKAAMRKAGVGDGDLHMALRTHGLEDLSSVQDAYLERNGDMTFIKRPDR